jgi:serine/threonine-protein kinase
MDELGKGGMGRVYRAFDTKASEEVALKLIRPEIASDKRTIERFGNELKMAHKIVHRHVGRMYHLGEEKGTHYITMEYVPGEDLKSLIKRVKKLTPGKAISIAKQVCGGLEEAHRLGVIHRDLKSSNIMIDKEGNAQIMDFGIALSPETRGLTAAGAIIGTPEYMSPEQVEGKKVDQRSDIYSFGIILYEMVTGRVPFEGDTPLSVSVKHKSETPKSPKEVNPQIPENLSRLILKCLEKNIEKRCQSARELLYCLTEIEKGIQAGELIIHKRRPLTSKGITLAFGMKRIVIPALVFGAIIISGLALLLVLPKRGSRPVSAHKRSIAVLPFLDLSPKKENEYLCDGIAENLISSLSALRDLRVPARTSAFSFKGRGQDIREIGHRLNVETVLEGSVQASGDRLRVTVQLINVADGFHLWSEKFDREKGDLFAIQDEIAEAVVRILKVEYLGEKGTLFIKHRPANSEAYHLYLQGRFFWNRREKESLEKAVEYFKEALERDPDYAPAYAGLADAYVVLGSNRLYPPDEAYPKAKEAALRALDIDEKLAEARTSLAAVKADYDWDFSGAEREYKWALELNPNYATARHWYALLLSDLGRHEEAISEIYFAQRLDPLSSRIKANVGLILYNARRYDQALEELKKALEIDPCHVSTYEYLGLVYSQTGRFTEAVEAGGRAIELGGNPADIDIDLACAYARSGNMAESRKILARIKESRKSSFVSPASIAAIHGHLGERDEAFDWLEKAYEERDPALLELKSAPRFDPLRTDPRFSALLKKIGLNE